MSVAFDRVATAALPKGYCRYCNAQRDVEGYVAHTSECQYPNMRADRKWVNNSGMHLAMFCPYIPEMLTEKST